MKRSFFIDERIISIILSFKKDTNILSCNNILPIVQSFPETVPNGVNSYAFKLLDSPNWQKHMGERETVCVFT